MSTDREIIVVGDGKAIAETAAQRLIKRLNDAKDRAAVCLTGGSSPEGLYRLLADEPWRSKVPWDRVHWFMGDDRFVPENDPLSNMGMARRLFLDKVPAPRGNVHAIPTDAIYPEGAANLYQDTLSEFYGAERLDPARPLFDLVLMGVGPDGHTASLFPGSRSARRERALGGRCREGRDGALGAARHPDISGIGLDARDVVHRRWRRQARYLAPGLFR